MQCLRSCFDAFLINSVLWSVSLPFSVRTWVRAGNSARTQKKTLNRLLRGYSRTGIGGHYGLTGKESVEQFRAKVPILDYEDHRVWITRQLEREDSSVLPKKAAAYYHTSGSTAAPKLLPCRAETLRWNRRAQLCVGAQLALRRPFVFSGKILGIGGSPDEEFSPHGVPIGSKSGGVKTNLPAYIRRKLLLPEAATKISDYTTKYRLILRLALQAADITYVQTANTSTLLLLSDCLNEHWDELIDDLREGTFHRSEFIESDIASSVLPCLKCDARRADELEEIRRRRFGKRVRLQDVWPDIQAVGCWIAGTSGVFAGRLRREVGEETLIYDLGYLASEVHGTSPLVFQGSVGGLPFFGENFYEFIPREKMENQTPEVLGLEELSLGGEYYVVVTTADGLLRYSMNDVLRVESFFRSLPVLSFVRKERGLVNITGEKVSEEQVLLSVREAERALDLSSTFFAASAIPEQQRYTLYYEPVRESAASALLQSEELRQLFDRVMFELNMEYREKRKSGRLFEPSCEVLRPGTLEALRGHWIASGKYDAQFKVPVLFYANDFDFDFSSHLLCAESESLRVLV